MLRTCPKPKFVICVTFGRRILHLSLAGRFVEIQGGFVSHRQHDHSLSVTAWIEQYTRLNSRRLSKVAIVLRFIAVWMFLLVKVALINAKKGIEMRKKSHKDTPRRMYIHPSNTC